MPYTTLIMFAVLIGAIFLMQRSQKKQAQERQNQLNAIAKGDEVVTIGGMYAVVDEVDNDSKKIVLDVDGVFLPFELTAIKRVIAKGGSDSSPQEESAEAIETAGAAETSEADADAESAIEE
ncbi:preprotein translocase subunit YajC [Streptococcus ratti]|uniref:Preprotein translocase subunit YajC n=1 Tax=Streptococcus ratti TaxID=1341 RepID=A0A7X9LEQ7_STRRT|nr:preprotein translocase subunit YajC [Streptococcus ratti]NMD49492.1 preprotein translocase subunit YajC [Streptococcus ratti]